MKLSPSHQSDIEQRVRQQIFVTAISISLLLSLPAAIARSSYACGMPLFSNAPALRLALAYAIHDPASLLPHAKIPTLLYLPIPVASGLPTLPSKQKPTIRALVLDKDNTLCPPNTSKLHQAYINKIEALKESKEFSHNENSILIVSNTAGSTSAPEHEEEAKLIEKELGLPVLRQAPGGKKPLCGPDVLKFFKEHGVTDNPAEIVFVGDRLATDVLIAREVGSWSYLCTDGWRNPEIPGVNHGGFWNNFEARVERFLTWYGKTAPLPSPQNRAAEEV